MLWGEVLFFVLVFVRCWFWVRFCSVVNWVLAWILNHWEMFFDFDLVCFKAWLWGVVLALVLACLCASMPACSLPACVRACCGPSRVVLTLSFLFFVLLFWFFFLCYFIFVFACTVRVRTSTPACVRACLLALCPRTCVLYNCTCGVGIVFFYFCCFALFSFLLFSFLLYSFVLFCFFSFVFFCFVFFFFFVLFF